MITLERLSSAFLGISRDALHFIESSLQALVKKVTSFWLNEKPGNLISKQPVPEDLKEQPSPTTPRPSNEETSPQNRPDYSQWKPPASIRGTDGVYYCVPQDAAKDKNN